MSALRRNQLSITLAGFLYVTQISVKQMLRQKSGSIVNISTSLVDHPNAAVTAAVQVMIKSSLHSVARALAIEYAKHGIRVNTVAAGVLNTPMPSNFLKACTRLAGSAKSWKS